MVEVAKSLFSLVTYDLYGPNILVWFRCHKYFPGFEGGAHLRQLDKSLFPEAVSENLILLCFNILLVD